MYKNRIDYPKSKKQMFEQLQILPKKYKVLALIKMENVRASQILQLRKKLKGKVEFISIKDRIAKKAFEKLNVPEIKKIIEQLTGQCMILFTDMSPFKLNVFLSKNKIMMSARGGDISSIDIVIPAKNTGIAPGPMLTEFKEANIPTKIDQGTIWIAKDTVPVKKGEPIEKKLAGLLGKLDIKPVEVGITLKSALEDNMQYTEDDLAVDIESVTNAISQMHNEAISLSIEAAYVTPENIKQILAKASQRAVSLSIESAFMTENTKKHILQKADLQARNIVYKAKNYTPN